MTARLVADNLHTQVAFTAKVMAHDPQAQWASINANHMLPSGSSLFHPHTQGAVDRFPTTTQALLSQVNAEDFVAYLETERSWANGTSGRSAELNGWPALLRLVSRSFAPSFPASRAQHNSLMTRSKPWVTASPEPSTFMPSLAYKVSMRPSMALPEAGPGTC
jgi:hypothetical protein